MTDTSTPELMVKSRRAPIRRKSGAPAQKKWDEIIEAALNEEAVHKTHLQASEMIAREIERSRKGQPTSAVRFSQAEWIAILDSLKASRAFTLSLFDICRTLHARLVAVEQREDGPQLAYRGVWTEGEQYERGSIVTHGGSAWHADAKTSLKPPSPDWTLMVKKGRDGRDAQP